MWKRLSLASKDLVNSYQNATAAYNTTFIFMFLNDGVTCQVYYLEDRGWLFLKYYCFDDERFYYLTPRGKSDFSDLVNFFQTQPKTTSTNQEVTIKCADVKWKKKLEPYTAKCLATPEEFDYVYLKLQLIELSHHKLRYKRKLLDDFMAKYTNTVSTRVIESSDRNEILGFFDQWAQGKSKDKTVEPSIRVEKEMLEKLFDDYENLNVYGVLVYITNYPKDNGCAENFAGDAGKQQIIGFSIAEILDEGTMLVHFEKADSSMRGASVYLVTQLLKQDQFTDIIYVNKQDDMGNPNLKQSKKSYLPTHLIEKYDLTLVI